MRQELDTLLCQRYPKMMANRFKDMQETCMCWGFDCGDGWFNLLDQLMLNIQHHIDWRNQQYEKYGHNQPVVQVVLDQVKEKFGTLRFYYTGGDEYIKGMVHLAESLSGTICERCGSGKATTLTKAGWYYTACPDHADVEEPA